MLRMTIWTDILDLFYPQLCMVCSRTLVTSETHICTFCYDELPRTGFHFQKENPTEKILWGRVPMEQAGSFLFFNKNGMTQNLLHHIKYRGRKELAQGLGRMYARELKNEQPDFRPDLIIPVPLHRRKENQRGYNQSLSFAEGLSEVLGVPLLPKAIKRKAHTATQTRKSRYRRWENVANVFSVEQPEALKGRHIAIVDDVITTGATLEACCRPLLEYDVRITIMTLAIARG